MKHSLNFLILFFIMQLAFAETPTYPLIAKKEDAKGAPLLVLSTDGGNHWARKSIDNVDNIVRGLFTAASCTGSGASAVCTVVGTNFIDASPLLVVGKQGGKTWKKKSFPDISKSVFKATSCTGNGSTAICVAVGEKSGKPPSPGPLIVVSSDGGNTWVTKSISLPGEVFDSWFDDVSCSGSGSSATCVAIGEYYITGSAGPFPILAVSINGGSTWELKSVDYPLYQTPIWAFFNTISCTGSGINTVCIAGGIAGSDSLDTFLVVSNDRGNTWQLKSINNPSSLNPMGFQTTSCIGSGATASCIAAGSAYLELPYLSIVGSLNAGNTWEYSISSPSIQEQSQSFDSISCTDSAEPICSAVGYEGTFVPLLTISTDKGYTWRIKSINDLPENSYFLKTSCTGNGISAICMVAGGQADSPNIPLLLSSNDAGNTWKIQKTISNLPPFGFFDAASCTGSGSTAICIAAGRVLEKA